MDPVKENVDKAMTQIHKTWWKHVNGLAEKFANHPDPEAWFKHFNQCLEDMEQEAINTQPLARFSQT
ncbi:hypothetical protein N0V85_007446, partial [Neurospora sp. IMI 360204]